jgi:hypothetical protein
MQRLFDLFGRSGTVLSIYLNVKEWIVSNDNMINLFFTVMISLLTMTYWLIKINNSCKKKNDKTGK